MAQQRPTGTTGASEGPTHYTQGAQQGVGTSPTTQPQQTGGGMQGGGMQGGGMQGGQMGMQQGGQTGMQAGQMGTQAGQEMGLTLDDVLTSEMRMALEDFTEAARVCEWCADQCIAMGDPGMAECIRLCRDVADLAALNVQFLARDSIFGPDAAETFAVAADACASECAQHPHAHCQECARVLQQAVEATWEMLDSLGGQQGAQAGGQGMAGQAPTGQSTTPGTGQAPQSGTPGGSVTQGPM